MSHLPGRRYVKTRPMRKPQSGRHGAEVMPAKKHFPLPSFWAGITFATRRAATNPQLSIKTLTIAKIYDIITTRHKLNSFVIIGVYFYLGKNACPIFAYHYGRANSLCRNKRGCAFFGASAFVGAPFFNCTPWKLYCRHTSIKNSHTGGFLLPTHGASTSTPRATAHSTLKCGAFVPYLFLFHYSLFPVLAPQAQTPCKKLPYVIQLQKNGRENYEKAEVDFQYYTCNTDICGNLFSVPDTLFAFMKKKSDKWWNFTFLSLFIVLTIISYICASYLQ